MHQVLYGRTVLTVCKDGWPVGVVTGQGNARGGFHVEHVIAFGPGGLLRLVRAGMQAAEPYAYLTFCVPVAGDKWEALARLGERLGFTRYRTVGDFDFYVRYAETGAMVPA